MQLLKPVLDKGVLKIGLPKLTESVAEIRVTFTNIPQNMPTLNAMVKACVEGELMCGSKKFYHFTNCLGHAKRIKHHTALRCQSAQNMNNY